MGVVEAKAKEFPIVPHELDKIASTWRSVYLSHFIAENPLVTVEDSFFLFPFEDDLLFQSSLRRFSHDNIKK
jgi:hypothetical protein